MKTTNLLKTATFSMILLFSVASATAQNFQHTKKKYSITKGSDRKIQEQVSYCAQNALTYYTDAELIKLSNYIQKLELQNEISGNSTHNPQAAETNVSKTSSGNTYTDKELIKLANYIKLMETTSSSTTVAAIKQ